MYMMIVANDTDDVRLATYGERQTSTEQENRRRTKSNHSIDINALRDIQSKIRNLYTIFVCFPLLFHFIILPITDCESTMARVSCSRRYRLAHTHSHPHPIRPHNFTYSSTVPTLPFSIGLCRPQNTCCARPHCIHTHRSTYL